MGRFRTAVGRTLTRNSTLHLTNPKAQTLDPQFQPLDPKPQTSNPKLKTLNPHPQTPNPERQPDGREASKVDGIDF